MSKIYLSDLEKYLSNFIDNITVNEDHFIYFKGQGIFTEDLYSNLLDSFPSNGFEFTTTEGYTNRGTKKFDLTELNKINPMWEVLLKGITSKGFIKSLGKKLGRKLYKERGLRVLLPWMLKEHKSNNILKNIFSLKLKADIRVDSIGKRGKINPHRDASRKLLTIMFYFPDEDWGSDWGGDTIFYKLKSAEAEKKFYQTNWRKKNNVSPEYINEFYDLFEEFDKGDFARNSISCLCANNLSYHAVNPINIDDSRRRKTIRLCLELDNSYTFFIKIRNRLFEIFRKF